MSILVQSLGGRGRIILSIMSKAAKPTAIAPAVGGYTKVMAASATAAHTTMPRHHHLFESARAGLCGESSSGGWVIDASFQMGAAKGGSVISPAPMLAPTMTPRIGSHADTDT